MNFGTLFGTAAKVPLGETKPMIPKNAKTIEMLDGRTYWSVDNWATVFIADPGGKHRELKGRSADMVRFLAASQSSS